MRIEQPTPTVILAIMLGLVAGTAIATPRRNPGGRTYSSSNSTVTAMVSRLRS